MKETIEEFKKRLDEYNKSHGLVENDPKPEGPENEEITESELWEG